MSIHQHPLAEGTTWVLSFGAVGSWALGWHQHLEWVSGEAVLWLPILNAIAAVLGSIWIGTQIYHKWRWRK